MTVQRHGPASHARRKMTTNQPHPLQKILETRIAIIDGAMGTTIRTYGMKESDVRGDRFKDSKKDLLNNGDIFSLTQPKMICESTVARKTLPFTRRSSKTRFSANWPGRSTNSLPGNAASGPIASQVP